ncbi:MAG TPA: purine-nucleoside phosphorylase, partial [Gemmatimonadaceae bacterium]|nr:purine-nucleoside phosphorylase [Gemmatimonadaceae bacterium]
MAAHSAGGDAASFGAREARVAADLIRSRIGPHAPVAAIVLGSGLGGLADDIEPVATIPYREIPGFPSATVAGHAGALIAGNLAGRAVLALAGRFHVYEGHDVRLAAFPARVMHAVGAPTLIVSNAAGGLNRLWEPGDLMLIRDHINLMFRNPLIGRVEPGDLRFPDMSAPYDDELASLA